ncbi:MAG: tyrosine-type recombinase/integrase [Candidatus Nitrotoga sp.]|nr:tyrosine-type recombinase/integrase [Candidatus Nitrotoga sp.]
MATLKLTKTIVESLPFTTSGQTFYRDNELKGFGLRVGSSLKVYIVESKINGKTVRATIGRHGVFTSEQARNEARQKLGMIARGINPLDDAKTKRAQSVTLKDVLDEFLKARKSLKQITVADYVRTVNVYFQDWSNKPITSITKDMIESRHRLMGESSEAQANLRMRYLRALFNFAIARYEDSQGNPTIADNPVKRLSNARAWYRVDRRQTLIRLNELPAWYAAVMNLSNEKISQTRESIRDYLLFLLFTGLRRNEGAQLNWDNIDFGARCLTITDTKNRLPHTLPLTDYLLEILQRRRAVATGKYVFTGISTDKLIVEPRKVMQHVTAESGIAFTLHDLRRTFITIAESLDIPAYALKRLLNHKMSNDVTAGYIINDVERLRAPMQKISDYILKTVGVIPTAEIVTLKASKRKSTKSN